MKNEPCTECREKLAAWMIKEGFSTGHGDSFDCLLENLKLEVDAFRHCIETLNEDES